mmetsp:Transcript_17003/g.47745  ORF Transcript_17003/g.47745 Transcript_17003/m.47745 type:complete len:420 (-) Transcript_17003:1825-3084(-)|eukprot:CAMPEP_0119561178 /NCGR_PEP_ID=MMETSP1352-20130426/16916_1 /TAXON_ID=265584 /ORGANISM="Stauroneis constricta, Strain CCMP1120" /LENGTH=419 /DNA_ID=CAMNT_0007609335 /DNA_START=311 /DNA_END=1570 /DNA_ORIENTATION=+
MATFVPYQVDYSSKNMSKTFGFSKKRVSFKFGVANNQSVQEGQTGAGCRGSEHEIIFVWSLNSGKRQILADGKDVHFSESGQNGWTSDQVFQHKFGLRVPGFDSPFKCHLITAPASKDVVGSRPFDLRVNGVSFFSFSKIFQLGTPGMMVRPVHRSRSRGGHGRGNGHHYSGNPEDDPYITAEERQAIAAAKLESLKEFSQSQQTNGQTAQSQATSIGNKDETSLISFDDPAPPPVPPRGQPNFVSSLTLDPSLQQHPPPQPPPPGAGAYSNYSLPPQQAPPMPPIPQQQAAPPFGAPNAMTPYYPNSAPPAGNPTPPFGAPPAYGGSTLPPTGLPPTAPGYSSMPPNRNALPSPSNQSYASYGSAPSFAQPPRPQQQQQQPPFGQPPMYGQAPAYGQPPAAAAPPYGFAQPPQGYAQY